MSHHQRQLHTRRTSSPIPKVWSHNTGFTGAAGIHSEVGLGAMARNHIVERRTSDVMSAEQEMMQKEMKAFQTNRKSLKKSMLNYSQKMREIAARRSQAKRSPVSDQPYIRPSHSLSKMGGRQYSKSHTGLIKSFNGVRLSSTVSPPAKELDLNLELEIDPVSKLPDIPSVRTERKTTSRLSLDSGISTGSNIQSVRSIPDGDIMNENNELKNNNSGHEREGCLSHQPMIHNLHQQQEQQQQTQLQDEEKQYQQQLQLQNKQPTQQHKARILHSQQDHSYPLTLNPEEIHARGRPKERKRFRDSKTFKLAQDSIDTEKENTKPIVDAEDEIETPLIVPFPYNVLSTYLDISPLILSSILENEELQDYDNSVSDSIFNKQSPRGGYGFSKPKTRTKYVLFRPKPSNSPSLSALKFRLFRRFRANSIYFRYSDEVLAALRSLSSSPDRRNNGQSNQSLSPLSKFSSRSSSPSKRPPCSPSMSAFSSAFSPTLHNIDLEELLINLAKRRGGLERLLQELEEAEEGNEFFLTKDTPKPPSPQAPVRERSSARSVRSAMSVAHKTPVPVTHMEQVDEAEELRSALRKEDVDTVDEKKNVQFVLAESLSREHSDDTE